MGFKSEYSKKAVNAMNHVVELMEYSERNRIMQSVNNNEPDLPGPITMEETKGAGLRNGLLSLVEESKKDRILWLLQKYQYELTPEFEAMKNCDPEFYDHFYRNDQAWLFEQDAKRVSNILREMRAARYENGQTEELVEDHIKEFTEWFSHKMDKYSKGAWYEASEINREFHDYMYNHDMSKLLTCPYEDWLCVRMYMDKADGFDKSPAYLLRDVHDELRMWMADIEQYSVATLVAGFDYDREFMTKLKEKNMHWVDDQCVLRWNIVRNFLDSCEGKQRTVYTGSPLKEHWDEFAYWCSSLHTYSKAAWEACKKYDYKFYSSLQNATFNYLVDNWYEVWLLVKKVMDDADGEHTIGQEWEAFTVWYSQVNHYSMIAMGIAKNMDEEFWDKLMAQNETWLRSQPYRRWIAIRDKMYAHDGRQSVLIKDTTSPVTPKIKNEDLVQEFMLYYTTLSEQKKAALSGSYGAYTKAADRGDTQTLGLILTRFILDVMMNDYSDK